jgi:hypothetical protein
MFQLNYTMLQPHTPHAGPTEHVTTELYHA